MPTMRRSTRALAKKTEDVEVNGKETPTRRGRATSGVRNGGQNGKAGNATEQWSGSSSPLSSISTPASGVGRSRRSLRQRAHSRAQQRGDSDEESDGGMVASLLSQAAAAIRDEVSNSRLTGDEDKDRLSGDEDEDNADDEGRSTRSRAAAATPGKRRRRAGSRGGSPASKHGSASDGEGAAGAKAEPNGQPRKRGRPSRQALEQRRLAEAGDNSDGEGAGGAQYLQTPTRGARAAALANGAGGGGDDSSGDDEAEKDAAGEAKIDSDGYLQGGREFICPIFRSPFRRNKRRQYVLTMDCCRYMGARDSYMLFKQHPRMRRVETTQQERDLLAERLMIPKVTRFRPIALITARTAFREFGARIVKNGRYAVDDYWEESRRREARHPEGTLVANMNVYHSVMAAHAAGMTPGSTRKARRTTPLRTGEAAARAGASTPTRSGSGFGGAGAAHGGMVVSSWVQLEAQQRMQQQQMAAAGVQSPQTSAAQMRAGGLTMANALQQQQPGAGALQGPHMQLLQQADAVDSDPDDAAKLARKPVFRKMRAPATAEAAFEPVVAVHRALFSEDHGFVDGLPLIRSMSASWPRATSLANKLKQRRGGSFGRADSPSRADPEERAAPDGSEDLFGPMAFASGKMAREFNASVRLWREDNGCTWIDPHTGVRQIPASLQPTAVRVERLDAGSSPWRRAGKTRIEPLVAFPGALPAADDGIDAAEVRDYPLALLPGQFQGTFPIHRTRFGQSYQQTMSSYSYHWMRLLALQQQQRKMLAQQQQQQQHQHAAANSQNAKRH